MDTEEFDIVGKMGLVAGMIVKLAIAVVLVAVCVLLFWMEISF